MASGYVFPKYTEEQYKRLLDIAEDRANFPDSYALWVETTERLIHDLARRDPDAIILRVDVDPDELAAWCSLQGHDVDYSASLAFAAQKMYKIQDAANPRSPRKNLAPRLEDQILEHGLLDSESENN